MIFGLQVASKEIKELIKDFLKDRGLELSDEKTLITHIDNGFDFLGWNFRKYNGKLLVKPSKNSIDKFTVKISDIIKYGKAWKQEVLIDVLNPIITGWANYHQSVVSSEIFQKLDSRIWGMLWHWAKRRHPEKSKHWIADKDYFISRKVKLGAKKLTTIAKKVCDEVKNICKPETMTMTNNCCPNKGLIEA
jgi:RNA-directed DNA polymerase